MSVEKINSTFINDHAIEYEIHVGTFSSNIYIIDRKLIATLTALAWPAK